MKKWRAVGCTILVATCCVTLAPSFAVGEERGTSQKTAITVPVAETDIRDAVLDAVSSEDFSDLSFMLRSATPAELIPIEKEILHISSALTSASKLDVAGELVEMLLLNNIDNTDAQDLLVTIQDGRWKQARVDALRRQIEAEVARKEAERQEAERQRLAEQQRIREAEEAVRLEKERNAAEIARKAVELQVAERQRLEEEKRQREAAEIERLETERVADEIARKEAEKREEERAETERKEMLLRRYTASADFSPVLLNAGASSFDEVDSSAVSWSYGFRIGAHCGYRESIVSVLWDLAYEYAPVSMSGEGTRSAFSTWIAVGSPTIRLPAYLYVGYLNFTISSGGDSPVFSFSKVGCPTFGLGMERYALIDRFDISGRIFWLPLSFAEEKVNFAFDIDLALRYKISNFGPRYGLYGLLGSTTTVIFAEGGTERSESAFIAIGVQIN